KAEIAARGQRSAGEHYGIEALPEQLAKQWGQIKRHSRQSDGLGPLTRAFHPAHGWRAAAGRAERAVETVADSGQPSHDPAQLLEQLPGSIGAVALAQPIGH